MITFKISQRTLQANFNRFKQVIKDADLKTIQQINSAENLENNLEEYF